MNVYDTRTMKQKAKEIEDAMNTFKTKGKMVKDEVEGLRAYWQDSTNESYLKKFSDFEPNILAMENHMRDFAKLLNAFAKKIEEITNQTNQSLR